MTGIFRYKDNPKESENKVLARLAGVIKQAKIVEYGGLIFENNLIIRIFEKCF
ncbi:MAG: hypothetical protein IJ795_01095 [Bacteroidales bacterium]|nr:hypothetical protein [Bacteroidales bacterium]